MHRDFSIGAYSVICVEDGAYQIWGLGVPLLRLPFEAISGVFGVPFPDRFVFVLLYFVTAWAFFSAPFLGKPLEWSFSELALRIGVTSLVLFNPNVLALVTTKFQVYEEAIGASMLWSVLLFAWLFRVSRAESSGRELFAFGAACGFAVFLRPTCLLYGVLGIGLLAGERLSTSSGRSRLMWATASFVAMLAAAALINLNNFGSMRSFGHEVSLTNNSDVLYALLWGNPFGSVDFMEAAREFAGALHSPESLKALASKLPRYREVYYWHYFGSALFVAGVALAGLVALILRLVRGSERGPRRLALWVLCWGAFPFCLFFVFYMRFNGLVSRYFAEFNLPIYLTMAGLPLALEASRGWRGLRKRSMAYCALAVFAIALGAAAELPSGQQNNVSGEEAVRRLGEWSLPQPKVPDEYLCASEDGAPAQEIPYNVVGWAMHGDCLVSASTLLFFDDPACIEVVFSSSNQAPSSVPIRVAVGQQEWSEVSSKSLGDVTQKVFCVGDWKPGRFKYSSLRRVLIGWVKTEELGAMNAAVQLRSARKLAR